MSTTSSLDELKLVEPGDTFVHFRIERRIGRGGMGVVFEATDLTLGRKVAIKVLRRRELEGPEADQGRARLLREARFASQLKHPHVAHIHEAGVADGVVYVAMELVEGETLRERVQRGPLQVVEVVRLARELASALAAVHALGLVHRDVKPGNVILQSDGSCKLLDFGLAKRGEHAEGENLLESLAGSPEDVETLEGQVVGTPGYMAPEQLQAGAVDARTDLFALGAVLYLMLTGREAFAGKTAMDCMVNTCTTEPEKIRALRPAVPDALLEVTHACLQRAPADRPDSAEAVLQMLTAVDVFQDRGEDNARLAEAEVAATDTITMAAPAVLLPRTPSGPLERGQRFVSNEEVEKQPKQEPSRSTSAFRRRHLLGAVVLVAVIIVTLVLWPTSEDQARVASRPLRVGAVIDEAGLPLYPTRVQSRQALVSSRMVSPPLLQRRGTELDHREQLDRVEVYEDGGRLRLHLREGLWFHPHHCLDGVAKSEGRVVEPEDVVYSLEIFIREHFLKPPIVGRDAFLSGDKPHLDGVSVVSGSAIEVRFAGPTAFPRWLIAPTQLVPRELEGCEDLKRMGQLVGVGPFRMPSKVTRDLLELEENPRWNGPSGSYDVEPAPRVSLRKVGTAERAFRALADDELDIVALGQGRFGSVVERDPDGRLTLEPEHRERGVRVSGETSASIIGTLYVVLGATAGGPLDDPVLREALFHMLDARRLSEAYGYPYGSGLLPPGSLGRRFVDHLAQASKTRGRQLLATVKERSGGELPTLRLAGRKDVRAELANQLDALGFKTAVGKWRSPTSPGGVDIHAVGWAMPIVDERDPGIFLSSFVATYAYLLGEGPAELRSGALAVSDRLLLEPNLQLRETLYQRAEDWLLGTNRFLPFAHLDRDEMADIWLLRADVEGLVDEATGLVHDVRPERWRRPLN